MRDGVWNRATDGEAPAGSYDGWGPGTDPRTGQPLPRPHLRHWLPGTVFADGSKPVRCWCQEPPPRATQAPERPKRQRVPKDTTPASSEASQPAATVPLTDTDAARLFLTWLRRLRESRAGE